jgi:hypothetical protein
MKAALVLFGNPETNAAKYGIRKSANPNRPTLIGRLHGG